jgi:hypothetical protein
MNQPATKQVAPGPVAVPRPPAFSALLGPGRTEEKFIMAQDAQERVVAAAMEKFRKEGGSLRQAVEWLADGYKFPDKQRFVDEITGMVQRLWPAPEKHSGNVEKFPDSMPLNRFLVSAFMMFEFTGDPELAARAADFCARRADGNCGAASIYSILLARIAGDAFMAAAYRDAPQEAATGMLSEEARIASQKPCRDSLQKTVAMAEGCPGDVRTMLHVMSAVSSLACRVGPCAGRIELLNMGRLPLPDRDPYMSFLRALKNVMLLSEANPAITGEFFEATMQAQRLRRDDLYFSAVAIISWAPLLRAPVENMRMVKDAFSALSGMDGDYLLALEEGLLRMPGVQPSIRHFNPRSD